MISRLQHPDPTPGCGKAQPQPSMALRNKLWPVQTGGAWTDTRLSSSHIRGAGAALCPLQSQNTALASTPRPASQRKEGKAHAACTPAQARAGSCQKAPVTQPALPFLQPQGLAAPPAPPRASQTGAEHSDRETLPNLYCHSKPPARRGEKGRGDIPCTHSAFWPKHVNLLVNVGSQLLRGGGRPREQDENS